MSYIDTFDNEFVGYFGGICVYHPLETVSAEEDDPRDFGCDPSQLVIGGGSGEHPAIVVKSPSEAVMFFLKAFVAESNSRLEPAHRALLKPIVDGWWSDQQRLFRDPWIKVFDFAGWRVNDHVRFAERCTSTAFHRPFCLEMDELVEKWLAESIGEFVLLAMPELVPDVIARLGELKPYVTGYEYQNILLAPPGYAVWGRREVSDKLHWNISAWKIERQHHPLTERTP